jgi:hypothetical protein
MAVATEIEELKELIRQQSATIAEMKDTVHKMHRAAVWSRVLSWTWWGAIILITTSVYYYFLGPYIGQIMELYSGASAIFENFRQ